MLHNQSEQLQRSITWQFSCGRTSQWWSYVFIGALPASILKSKKTKTGSYTKICSMWGSAAFSIHNLKAVSLKRELPGGKKRRNTERQISCNMCDMVRRSITMRWYNMLTLYGLQIGAQRSSSPHHFCSSQVDQCTASGEPPGIIYG